MNDQPDGTDQQTDLSRRRLLALAATACAACACGPLMRSASADPQPDQKPAGKTFDVGPLSNYDKDGMSDKFVRSHSVFVIREQGKLFACTSICPHKGATLKIKGNEIWCPRHGSLFSDEGELEKGPADSSLERYAISVNDDKHVIVDPSTSFREKDWDDPASFIKI